MNPQIEVLQAEVQALKALVITSTPSMPNKNLSGVGSKKTSLLRKKKTNNPSHHRNHSLTGPIKDSPDCPASQPSGSSPDQEGPLQQKEV